MESEPVVAGPPFSFAESIGRPCEQGTAWLLGENLFRTNYLAAEPSFQKIAAPHLVPSFVEKRHWSSHDPIPLQFASLVCTAGIEMNSPRITLADIAKVAGVHVTTVSAALRNHPRLPDATKQRIQSLAQKMGYRPDPALASLVAYRTQKHGTKTNSTLAYITNWDSKWGWKSVSAHADFFAGAVARAQALGYSIEHFWLGETGLSHRRLSEILYTRSISGLIFASHRQETDDEIAFDWSKFSAVKIDFSPHRPALHHVTNHQRAIMQLAMGRIVERGYRRVGCVMPRWWDAFVDRAWSSTFLGEQQLLGPGERIPILFFSEGRDEFLVPPDAFRAWYEEYRPEVLITYMPFVAEALKKLKLTIPDDLCLVDLFLKKFDGEIAGVRQNCTRVGEVAVEILVGQLQQFSVGLPAFPTSTLVEGTWFDGKTLPERLLAESYSPQESKNGRAKTIIR